MIPAHLATLKADMGPSAGQLQEQSQLPEYHRVSRGVPDFGPALLPAGPLAGYSAM